MNWDRLYLKWLHKWEEMGYAILKKKLRGRVTFGPRCSIYPKGVFYQGMGKVIFDEGCIIERDAMGAHFFVEDDAEVHFGPRMWIRGRYRPNVFSCTQGAKIEIGADSMVAGITISVKAGLRTGIRFLGGNGVKILDADFHDLDNSHPEQIAPITIGDYVWLTADVIVLKGVTIGDHCVIGAGSIVTEDIPPYSLAVGRPAKPIKTIGDRSKTR